MLAILLPVVDLSGLLVIIIIIIMLVVSRRPCSMHNFHIKIVQKGKMSRKSIITISLLAQLFYDFSSLFIIFSSHLYSVHIKHTPSSSEKSVCKYVPTKIQ